MTFNREECACFTGHRVVKRGFSYKQIDNAIEELYERGFKVYLNGMALGFDTLCFKRLIVMRKVYPDIKIIACVPCLNQAELFRERDKKIYDDLLSKADEKIVISEEYNDACMKERDRFMVDNSSVCVSYIYKSQGGAYYTTKYAVEKKLEIIYLK